MGDNLNFSNLVIWGNPIPIAPQFELTQFDNLIDFSNELINNKIKVLVINKPDFSFQELESLIMILDQQLQNTEIILLIDPEKIELNLQLISILNPINIFNQNNFINEAIESSLLNAIQKYDYHKQNHNFYLLFQEQSEELTKINNELEERVLAKNKSLKRSQSRLLYIKDQLLLMYECIIGVQNAKSVADIEDFLTEKLTNYLQIKWIRILITQNELYNETLIIEAQKKFKIFGTPLYFDKKNLGHIYFAKTDQFFKKKEEPFLLQLSEIVSIKINQIVHYSDLLINRKQWLQTFNAIKHQVTIIDSDYNLLNGNFNINHENKNICYKTLFNRDKPCDGCQIGKKFEINNDSEWLKVTSQSLKNYEEKSDVFINIYQNITEQKIIEMKILEKTKSSDLGILAGSLAHELNNPLAGIITFLQLILTDPAFNNHRLRPDIQDLLNSAQDCKQVIQMILESVRNNKDLILDNK